KSSDGAISGKHDIIFHSKPYPISDGKLSLTIQDQIDPACKTMVTIDPPIACSHSCNLKISVKDSCHVDATRQKSIYYFLKANLPAQNAEFWIYHKGRLIDIIPGMGDILLGPF